MPSPPFECKDVCQTILGTVFPSLGIVTSSTSCFICLDLIYLSPLPAVLKVLDSKDIGEVNTLPFAMMFINGFAWMLYGIYIKNWFVFASNILSAPMGLYYCLSCLNFDESNRKMTIAVLSSLFPIFLITAAVAFINLQDQNYQAGWWLTGMAATVISLFFYGSPLSTMAKVIKSKNSLSINIYIALTCALNAFLWTIYGLLILDMVIMIPNAIGLLLSLMQIWIKIVYRSNPKQDDINMLSVQEVERDEGTIVIST